MSLRKRIINILFGEMNIEILKEKWREIHESGESDG